MDPMCLTGEMHMAALDRQIKMLSLFCLFSLSFNNSDPILVQMYSMKMVFNLDAMHGEPPPSCTAVLIRS